MKREDLVKLAEAGVRQRLVEIQNELNALAADFPHLVKNQDGSMPAVTPVTAKGKAVKNPEVQSARKAAWAALSPKERAEKVNQMNAARLKNKNAKKG